MKVSTSREVCSLASSVLDSEVLVHMSTGSTSSTLEKHLNLITHFVWLVIKTDLQYIDVKLTTLLADHLLPGFEGLAVLQTHSSRLHPS